MSNTLLSDIEQTSSAKQDSKNHTRGRNNYLPFVSKTNKNNVTANHLVKKSINVNASIYFRSLCKRKEFKRKESKRKQRKQLASKNFQNMTTAKTSQNFLFLLGLSPKCSKEKIDIENNLLKGEDYMTEEKEMDEDVDEKEEEEDALFRKPEIFECHDCYKIFFHKPLYRKHVLRHMKLASRCRICGQSLVTKYLYKRHRMTCR